MARKFYEREGGHKCVHIQSDYDVIIVKKATKNGGDGVMQNLNLNGRKPLNFYLNLKYFLF